MELIDREELLKDLKTSAIYHANNSREETLMYRDRNIVREQPTVEAIPKDQYEARLKADMVAILVELQLDVEEQKFDVHIDRNMWNDAIGVCLDLIQQKINELKEKT